MNNIIKVYLTDGTTKVVTAQEYRILVKLARVRYGVPHDYEPPTIDSRL